MAKPGMMRGLSGTPLDQTFKKLSDALCAADKVVAVDNGMIPSPIIVVKAEIRNAIAFLELVKAEIEASKVSEGV